MLISILSAFLWSVPTELLNLMAFMFEIVILVLIPVHLTSRMRFRFLKLSLVKVLCKIKSQHQLSCCSILTGNSTWTRGNLGLHLVIRFRAFRIYIKLVLLAFQNSFPFSFSCSFEVLIQSASRCARTCKQAVFLNCFFSAV